MCILVLLDKMSSVHIEVHLNIFQILSAKYASYTVSCDLCRGWGRERIAYWLLSVVH